ncbi:hypothetical protein BD410DRAFT_509655 [Rickenella mellea]|uniref:Uncharacterized protein n=1 Tax=Rickenella mellea TaxID=50990 RepID=A0A4Y7PSQ9_9AGAM|nr:hypothetical protein BD410DRAFT_509655 [Rickenella mellea]
MTTRPSRLKAQTPATISPEPVDPNLSRAHPQTESSLHTSLGVPAATDDQPTSRSLWQHVLYLFNTPSCLRLRRGQTHQPPKRSIFDTVVLVAFCVSLVVYIHALAGFGVDPTSNPYVHPNHTKNVRLKTHGPSTYRDALHAHVSVDIEGDFSAALRHIGDVDTATDALPTLLSFDRPMEPPRLGEFLDSLGRPFALKIHMNEEVVLDDEVVGKRRSRCRNSDGGRCL